jgi:hypothetical protein
MINDGNLSSAVVSRTVSVMPVNDVPVLSGVEQSSLPYMELSPAMQLSAAIVVTDVDFITDANLDSATISISPSTSRRGDYLAYLPGNATTPSFAATYDTFSAVLSMTGSATPAEWQIALRSVLYWSTSGDPTGYGGALDKVISFAVSDGDSTSSPVTRVITVTPKNNEPILSGIESTVFEYMENGAAEEITSTIMASDADVPEEDMSIDSQLVSAIVTVSAGFRAGDSLGFSDSSSSITPRFNASTGVLLLTGNASVLSWQAALRLVTYSSSSEDPTGTQLPSNRTISFAISDGTLISALQLRTVIVTPVNDAPVLVGIAGLGELVFTENDPPAVVYGLLIVSDVDYQSDLWLNSATVSISDGLSVGDILALDLDGTDLGITSTYDKMTGVLLLTGEVSQANWQQALRMVVFKSSLDVEGGLAYRSISFRTNDGDSHSNIVQRTVKVVPLAGNFSFEAAAISVREHDSTAAFCVHRSGAFTGEVVVTLTLLTFTNVTAAVDATSQLRTTTLAFAHKQLSNCSSISIIDDNLFQQHPMMFTANIESAVSLTGGEPLLVQPRTCTLTVQDDGDAGTFGFQTLLHRANETNPVSSLGVVRSPSKTSGAVRVYYVVNGVTASHSDVKNGTGYVDFVDGATKGIIDVSILDDAIFDPEERFTVTLTHTVVSSCDNVTGDNAQCYARLDNNMTVALVTILDNGDEMPPLQPPAPNLGDATGGSIALNPIPPLNIGGYNTAVSITDYRTTMHLANGSRSVLRETYMATDWLGPYVLRLSTTSLIVTGLSAATDYTFSVAARNDGVNRNFSVDSPTATYRTTHGQPPSPPTKLTVAAVTGGSVTVHWTAPLDLGGTPIRRYVLYGCDEFPDRASCDSGAYHGQVECPASKVLAVSLTASAGTARFTTMYRMLEKLHYGCPYRVRLAAESSSGIGSPTEWLSASTSAEPSSPGPPTEVASTSGVDGVFHTGGQLNIIVSRPLDEGGRSVDGFQMEVFGPSLQMELFKEGEMVWATCYSGPGKDLAALQSRRPNADLSRAHDSTVDPFCNATDVSCTRSLVTEDCSLVHSTNYRVRLRVFRTTLNGSTEFGVWESIENVTTATPTTPGPPMIFPPVFKTGGRVRLTMQPPNDFGGVAIQRFTLFIFRYWDGDSTWGSFCPSTNAACTPGAACEVTRSCEFDFGGKTAGELAIHFKPSEETRWNATVEVNQLRANSQYRFVALANNLISAYEETQVGCDCENTTVVPPSYSQPLDILMPNETEPLPVRDLVQKQLWFDGFTPKYGANVSIAWTSPLDAGGAVAISSYTVEIAPMSSSNPVGLAAVCAPAHLQHYAFPRVSKSVPGAGANCTPPRSAASFDYLCAHTDYNISVTAVTVGSDGKQHASSKQVLVVRTGKPRPPGKILAAPVIVSTTSSTINITWMSPIDVGGSALASYRVYFTPLSRTVGAVSGYQELVLSGIRSSSSSQNLVLTDLVANTQYSVGVAAVNGAPGVGPISDTAFNSTRLPAAPADPAPPQIMAASGGGVALQLPAPADTGGVPTSDIVYQIVIDGILTLCVQSNGKQYKPPNNGNSGCKVADTSALRYFNRRRLLSVGDSSANSIRFAAVSHGRRLSNTGVTLGGLLSSSTYSLSLRVENSLGVSPPTEPQALETTAPTVPSAPNTPTELVATTDSYQIAWKAPPDTGGSPLIGFNVYQSNSSGVFSLLCPACSSSVATIDYIHHNLGPSEQYYYKVSALNVVGESANSTVLVGITQPLSGPSPPRAVLLQARSASSVTVTWIAPLSFGGYPFSHYQIAIHVGHSSGYDTYPESDIGWVVITTLDDLVGIATDLQADTKYSVRVRAVSTHLNGHWSDPYDVKTQRTGTVVDAPTAGCITSTSAEISWTLPSINTSIIEVPGFKVQVWRAATASSARVLLETNDVTSVTTLEMTGLESSTQYEFAVGTVVKDIATSVVTQPSIFSSLLITSTTANAQVSTCHGATGSFDSANAAGVGYAASETRSWTIMPIGASATSYTVITFTRFNLECDHDSVTIYGLNDAGDINSTIWSGGCSRPGISTFRIGAAFCDFASCSADSVKSHIRGVKVVLTSDGHVQEGDSATTGGFALEYATDMPIELTGNSIGIQCPASSSNMDGAVCSNRGTCAAAVRMGVTMESSGSCGCSSGFASEDCSNIDCGANYLAGTANSYRKYVCGFSASSSSGASATQVSVAIAPFGSDTAGTGSASNDGKSPKPYKTLTSALATATASASLGQSVAILLYPGTYSGDANCGLDFASGNVQLVSVSAAGGVPETILDCTSWQNGRRLAASKPILQVGAGSTVAISGVHFKGGSAGGVAVTGGNVSFDRCYFTGNTHTLGAGLTATAGAVVSVSNSLIHGNNASTDGGGVYIDDSTALSLSATTVSGNSASRGAGVFVGSGSSIIGSSASAVSGNTAGSDGGGVFVVGNGIVTGLSVASNDAVRGGGLFWQISSSSALSLASLTVSSNTASSDGGGVFVIEPSDASGARRLSAAAPAQLTMKDTVITGNIAANSGGGLYITGATVATGSDSTVLSLNSAGANGGGAALYNMSGVSQFTAFSMEADSASRGGGMYVSSGTPIMQNLWISGCDATCSGSSGCVAYGGGIFIDADTSTTTSNCTAVGNRANAGAGIFVADSSTVTFPNVAATTTTFAWHSTGNTAEHGGGLLLHGGASVTKFVVEGNTATGAGGGAFVAGAGESACADCVVRSNNAAKGGGIAVNGSWLATAGTISAISVATVSTAAYLHETVVSDNTAISGGGAYVTGSALLHGMTAAGLGALLSSNAATEAGGAIACSGGATVRSVRLTNSSAGNGTGGGVFVATGGASGGFSCALELADIVNCTAADGGSTYVSVGASLRLASSSMSLGVAARGGNLFVDSSATVTHTNSTLSHGQAVSGGSVYLHQGSLIEFDADAVGGNGSTLIFGSASHAGGNLFTEGISQASGLLVSRGTAPVGGGAMVSSGSSVAISTSIIEHNTAECSNTSAVPVLGCGGGGIAAGGHLGASVTLHLTQVVIRSNTAIQHGGGLLLYNTNLVHSKSVIKENSALVGGGISVCNTDTYYTMVQSNGCSVNITASSASNSSYLVSSTGVVTKAEDLPNASLLNPTSVMMNNRNPSNSSVALGPHLFVSSGARLSIAHMRVSGGTTAHGGGLFLAKASDAQANFCVFSGCIATTPNSTVAGSTPATGGAIYVTSGSRLSLGSSYLFSNMATDTGGAVDLAPGAVLVSIATVFSANTAIRGGAVYMSPGSEWISNGDRLVDNAAVVHGGSVAVQDASLMMSNATVIGSRVMSSAETTNVPIEDRPLGGAIYQSHGSVRIVGSLLSGADAAVAATVTQAGHAHSGGLVYATGNGLLHINTSTLRGGAAMFGGALHMRLQGAFLTDSLVTGNAASEFGGGLSLDVRSTLTLVRTVVSDNICSFDGGGAFVDGYSNLACERCSFANNSAEDRGGGVFLAKGENVLVASSASFTGNRAHLHGGAIMAERRTVVRDVGSTFTSNGKPDGTTECGGAVFITDATVYFNGSSFALNSAIDGGALFFERKTDGHMVAVGFTANSASDTGGAMVVQDTSTAVVAHSWFHGNQAKFGGAVQLAHSASTDLHNVSALRNIALDPDEKLSAAGGGFLLCSGLSKCVVTQSNLQLNKANGNGGAVAVEHQAILTLTQTGFKQNTAGVRGGGVFASHTAGINITSLNFDADSAIMGPAVFWHYVPGELLLECPGCSFVRLPCLTDPQYGDICPRINGAAHGLGTNAAGLAVGWFPTTPVMSGQPIVRKANSPTGVNVGSQAWLAKYDLGVDEALQALNLTAGVSNVTSNITSVERGMMLAPYFMVTDYYQSRDWLDDSTSCALADVTLKNWAQATGMSNDAEVSPSTAVTRAGQISFPQLTLTAAITVDPYTLQLTCMSESIAPEDSTAVAKLTIGSCTAGFELDERIQQCRRCANETYSIHGQTCMPCPLGGNCTALAPKLFDPVLDAQLTDFNDFGVIWPVTLPGWYMDKSVASARAFCHTPGAPCEQPDLQLDAGNFLSSGTPKADGVQKIYICKRHFSDQFQWDERRQFQCLTGYQLYRCKVPAACVGGVTWNSMPGQGCALGYEGVKCSVCSSGYTAQVSGECQKCSSDVSASMNSSTASDGDTEAPTKSTGTALTVVFTLLGLLLIALAAEFMILRNTQNETLLKHTLNISAGHQPLKTVASTAVAVDSAALGVSTAPAPSSDEDVDKDGWVPVRSGRTVSRFWAQLSTAASSLSARMESALLFLLHHCVPHGAMVHEGTLDHETYMQAAVRLDERTHRFHESRKEAEALVESHNVQLFDLMGTDRELECTELRQELKGARDNLHFLVMKWKLEQTELRRQLIYARDEARPATVPPFGILPPKAKSVPVRIMAALQLLLQPEKAKIIVGFAQVLSAVQSSYEVAWPQNVNDSLKGFNWMNLEVVGMFSLDCLGTVRFYDKLLYYSLALPVLLSLLYTVHSVGLRRYRAMLVDIPRRCIESGQPVRENHDADKALASEAPAERRGAHGAVHIRRGAQSQDLIVGSYFAEGKQRRLSTAAVDAMATGTHVLPSMRSGQLGIPHDDGKKRPLAPTGWRVAKPESRTQWGSLAQAQADFEAMEELLGEEELDRIHQARAEAEERAAVLGQEKDDSIIQWLLRSALPLESAKPALDRAIVRLATDDQFIASLPGMRALQNAEARSHIDLTSTKILLRAPMGLSNIEIMGVSFGMTEQEVHWLQYAAAEIRLNFQQDLVDARTRFNTRVWRARCLIRMNFGFFRDKICHLLFGILVIFYIPLGSVVLAAFPCEEVGSVYYLRADMRLRCWDNTEHLLYVAFAAVGVVAFVIGIPLSFYRSVSHARSKLVPERIAFLFPLLGSLPPSEMALRYLKRRVVMDKVRETWQANGHVWAPYTGSAEDQTAEMKRRVADYYRTANLEHYHTVRQIGFIMQEYKVEYWWFELLEVARKILLTGGVLFLQHVPDVQLLVGTAVCFFCTCLVVTLQPYRNPTSNSLAGSANAQLSLMMYVGFMIQQERRTSAAGNMKDSIRFVDGLALLLVMCTWLLFAVFLWTGASDIRTTIARHRKEHGKLRSQALEKKVWRMWRTVVDESQYGLIELLRTTENLKQQVEFTKEQEQELEQTGAVARRQFVLVEKSVQELLEARRQRAKNFVPRIKFPSLAFATVHGDKAMYDQAATDGTGGRLNIPSVDAQVTDAVDLAFFDGSIPPVNRKACCNTTPVKVHSVAPEAQDEASAPPFRARIRSAPRIDLEKIQAHKADMPTVEAATTGTAVLVKLEGAPTEPRQPGVKLQGLPLPAAQPQQLAPLLARPRMVSFADVSQSFSAGPDAEDEGMSRPFSAGSDAEDEGMSRPFSAGPDIQDEGMSRPFSAGPDIQDEGMSRPFSAGPAIQDEGMSRPFSAGPAVFSDEEVIEVFDCDEPAEEEAPAVIRRDSFGAASIPAVFGSGVQEPSSAPAPVSAPVPVAVAVDSPVAVRPMASPSADFDDSEDGLVWQL